MTRTPKPTGSRVTEAASSAVGGVLAALLLLSVAPFSSWGGVSAYWDLP